MRLQVTSTRHVRYCRWCVYVVHVRCVQCVAHGDSGAAIVVLYGTVSGVFYVVHVHYVIIIHAFSIALFPGERAERVYLHTCAYVCL